MTVLLLAALAAAIGAAVTLASAPRTAFVLGVIVSTNASAVIHDEFGVPAFLLPFGLLILGVAGFRFVMRGRLSAPSDRLPVVATAVIAAILLSAAMGPFVALGASSSWSAVQLLVQHMIVVAAVVVVCRTERGFIAALFGIATGGFLLSALTNLQALTNTRSASWARLGAGVFGSWNQEVLGGTGNSLRAAGPFTDDPNAYAQYLVVAVAVAAGLLITVGRRWSPPLRWSAGGAIASIVVAIAQSASRGAMVGLVVVGVIVMALDGLRRRRVAIIGVAVLVLLLSPLGIGSRLSTLTAAAGSATTTTDSGLRGRASEMLAAVDMFVDHPVTGVGYGTYNDRYLDYSRRLGIDNRYEPRSAHSLPLEIAAEQGLIGIGAWLAFIAFAVVVVSGLRRRSAELGTPFALALAGFATTAVFLHDVHPRLMWTLVGLTLAASFLQRSPSVVPLAHGEPVRVAMLIQSYVPAVGGAERQLANLVPLLVERGVEPLVVTRSMPGRPRDDEVDGVPVVRLRVAGPKLVQSIMYVTQARAVLRRFDPHVTHAYDTLTPSSIALDHRDRTGCPVVTKILRSGELGDLYRLGRKPFGLRRRRRLIANVDAFVAISSDIDAELAALGVAPERRHQIHNGVDTERFRPGLSRSRGKGPRRGRKASMTVVATGRLAPEKRLVELGERWSRVTDRWPGTRLVVAGDGPDADRLRALRVELLGRVDDVSAVLRSADLYVSASRAEGLSNSLLEAMAAGLPCVVTDVGGVRDVITGSDEGEIVPPDDLDAFVDAIVALLGDPSRRARMSRAARARIEHRFELRRTADELTTMYRELAPTPDADWTDDDGTSSVEGPATSGATESGAATLGERSS